MVGTVEGVTIAVFCIVAIAEYIHFRRCRKVGKLIFGPQQRGYNKIVYTPVLRLLALTLLTWGLSYLVIIPPSIQRSPKVPASEYNHVVVVLDVSPSMKIKDSGSNKRQTRLQRAGEVMQSIIRRLATQHTDFSVIAAYNGARHVVLQTKDLKVVKNIFDDLPMGHAFESGKTKLLVGIEHAVELTAKWRENSTLLVLISDGDTVPDEGMPSLTKAIATTLVVGVGDRRGMFIDGHLSRQESSILRQIAKRLQGHYQNGNTKYVSTYLFENFTVEKSMSQKLQWDLQQRALLSTFVGASILLLLGMYLEKWGSNWP